MKAVIEKQLEVLTSMFKERGLSILAGDICMKWAEHMQTLGADFYWYKSVEEKMELFYEFIKSYQIPDGLKSLLPDTALTSIAGGETVVTLGGLIDSIREESQKEYDAMFEPNRATYKSMDELVIQNLLQDFSDLPIWPLPDKQMGNIQGGEKWDIESVIKELDEKIEHSTRLLEAARNDRDKISITGYTVQISAYNDCKHLLKHMKIHLPAPVGDNWESLSNPPEVGKYVLVNVGTDTVLKGRLMNNGWTAMFADGEKLVGDVRPVTGWQPLPAPPQK